MNTQSIMWLGFVLSAILALALVAPFVSAQEQKAAPDVKPPNAAQAPAPVIMTVNGDLGELIEATESKDVPGGKQWQIKVPVLPPPFPRVKGTRLVQLRNNKTKDVDCSIEYFTRDGSSLGPLTSDPDGNTFTLKAMSTLMFVPCKPPPPTYGAEGALIKTYPDRPQRTDLPGGTGTDGSAVIKWIGDAKDIKAFVPVYSGDDAHGR